MKIATLLFTYARSKHTSQVLEALKENSERPQKLFVFQDGKKESTDCTEWTNVNSMINQIDWCEKEIIISESNKGLTKSIVNGINYAFEQYDAVIVLEDDCVPHPLFLTYMYSALEHYTRMERVYTICGYGYPIEVEPNGTDTYFTQRTSSWGWATWKDKWAIYEEDYKVLGRIKNNPFLSEQLHIWGEDLENYLLGNIYGTCNSWATFWSLNVLEHDGYCVAPYKSLVENIGMDGSGEHCGKQDVSIDMLEKDRGKEFVFYDDLYISEQTKKNYSCYWAWKSVETRNSHYYYVLLRWMELHSDGKTINDYFMTNRIEKICIWGKGRMCDLLLKELDDKREFLAIIESKPSGVEYKEIQVVSSKDIPEETECIVIIPEYDSDKILWQIEEKWWAKTVKLSEVITNESE